MPTLDDYEELDQSDSPPQSQGQPSARFQFSSAPAPTASQQKQTPRLNVEAATELMNYFTENPHWFQNKNTAAIANNIFKGASDVIGKNVTLERLKAATLSEQSKLKDLNSFHGELDKISPEDRASIRTLAYNDDGSVSRTQWEALSLAQRTLATKLENERAQAALEAQARGDTVATTVTEKGVTKSFKPNNKATPEESQPRTQTLNDGTVLAWMPKGNTIHVIKGQKSEKMTPNQLLQVSKGLMAVDSEDRSAKQINEFLAATALKEIAPKSSEPSGAAQSNPYKVGATYKGGLKYLGGDPNKQESWEQVK